jgi:phosphatidylglycerol:prolipoprotein diacylglycerol transferase
MQRTLFLIPHEFAGIPVLGVGWLLMVVVAALAIRLLLGRRRGVPAGQIVGSEGVMWGALAAAIVFVLPVVELQNLDGEPVGMAIRGYGVMLLGGVVAAVALAAYRARRSGIDPELIYTMAPWVFFGGIIGARLFFVIQYFDEFRGASLLETAGNMLRFTEGGLVVYGSFIGGFAAFAFFTLRHRLPLLKLGDVIVPCIFLGIFFGRIGCLMNGCCYGGRCEEGWLAIQFPPTSAVYQEQLRSGELLGFRYDPDSFRIESVRQDSLADQRGIAVDSKLDEIADDLAPLAVASREIPGEDVRRGIVVTVDGTRHGWKPDQLPPRALPVYAAQLLSSGSSLVLCLFLCTVSRFGFRDGSVMIGGFASYAVVRFVLEWVRVDELGQFGTSLSISQWVSLIVFSASLLGLWWVYRTPLDAAIQPQATPGN